jgi:anti-anti-sigma factor
VTTTTGSPSRGRADPPTTDHSTEPADTAVPVGGGDSVQGLAHHGTPAELLGLTVQHPAVSSTEVTICTEQVALLSVIGRLDEAGLTQLRQQLQAAFDTDIQYLVVNLAGVVSCDHRLFDVLVWVQRFLSSRRGWMRLVGVGPAVHNALDEATLSEYLLVDQASDWTGDLTG